MSDGIAIEPTRAGVAHDLDHALEHVPARIDLYTGITEENNS
jgi:hypothetical protein